MAAAVGSTAVGHAYGAAVVLAMGQRTAYRSGAGGYARITGSTVYFNEAGDPMPGQPFYDTAISFLPAGATAADTSLNIKGGRDFLKDVYVTTNGTVTDVTGAKFIAQIRRHRYSKYSMAQFAFTIVDGPAGHVQLSLNPVQTGFLAKWMTTGVWDLEMQLGGKEYTVISESAVTVTPGISQGTIANAGTGVGTGTGGNAT